ncbi:AB hydrolase superfamily protein [Abortiporus biennis]
MDPKFYKSLITSRGLTYSYYISPPPPPRRKWKTTILFCHGFPSSSTEWRYQVAYFQKRGYRVIAPDMLGYGGTDKVTDPAAHKPSLLCRDMIDILEAEDVQEAVAIGHDLGTLVVSRLSNYYPERFIGFAFLAGSYIPVTREFDMNDRLSAMRQRYGYDVFGYWLFFGAEDAESIIHNHWDSFFGIMYPHDPALWKTHFAPVGAMKQSLLADEKFPLPSYMSPADKQSISDALLNQGMSAPLAWYRMATSHHYAADESVPLNQSLPPASTPIFFGGAKYDYVCRSDMGTRLFASDMFKKHNVTIREFEADHWLILSVHKEVNRELEAWLENVVRKFSTGSSVSSRRDLDYSRYLVTDLLATLDSLKWAMHEYLYTSLAVMQHDYFTDHHPHYLRTDIFVYMHKLTMFKRAHIAISNFHHRKGSRVVLVNMRREWTKPSLVVAYSRMMKVPYRDVSPSRFKTLSYESAT